MADKLTAAVCIDFWKLDIFSEELHKAGYTFTKNPGVTPDTLTLSVSYTDMADLELVCRRAIARARLRSMN